MNSDTDIKFIHQISKHGKRDELSGKVYKIHAKPWAAPT